MCYYHSHAKTKNAKRDTRKYPRPISMQSEHNARAYIPLGRTKKWGWAHKTNQNARGRNMRPPWVATPMQGNFSRQLLCKAIPKECKVSSSMLGRRHVCKVSSHSIKRFGRLSAETKIHIKIYIKTLKSQKSLISCQKLTKIEIIKAIMISDRCVKFLRILLNGFEDNRQKPKFT